MRPRPRPCLCPRLPHVSTLAASPKLTFPFTRALTLTLTFTLASTLTLAPALQAQTKPPRARDKHGFPRLSSGLFAGAALPAGRASENVRMEDALGTSAVVGTDVGFRLHPNWEITPELLALIPVTERDYCEPCDEEFAILVSATLRFHPLAQRNARVWAGVGPGGEWLRLGRANHRGLLVALQLGADTRLSDDFWLGGFAGAYTGTSLTAPPSNETGGSHIIYLLALRLTTDTPI